MSSGCWISTDAFRHGQRGLCARHWSRVCRRFEDDGQGRSRRIFGNVQSYSAFGALAHERRSGAYGRQCRRGRENRNSTVRPGRRGIVDDRNCGISPSFFPRSRTAKTSHHQRIEWRRIVELGQTRLCTGRARDGDERIFDWSRGRHWHDVFWVCPWRARGTDAAHLPCTGKLFATDSSGGAKPRCGARRGPPRSGRRARAGAPPRRGGGPSARRRRRSGRWPPARAAPG